MPTAPTASIAPTPCRRAPVRWLGLGLLCAALWMAPTAPAGAQPAGPQALQDEYRRVEPRLARNEFNRPLTLASAESSDRLNGDIHAVIAHPFDTVSGALSRPAAWCEVLMLHLNTKHCAVGGQGGGTTLTVAVGRKFDQPLSQAQSIAFQWQPPTVRGDYMEVRLQAAQGPFSTHDYRLALQAVPLDGGKTFIHLSYAYGYGTAARLALQGYLATLGSDKVGFSVTGKDAGGKPQYVGGVRGVVERNTMRYYLAIDAYLDAPADAQRDQRLAAWFDATERYSRQLHEVERGDYLAMKRNEFQRMQGAGR